MKIGELAQSADTAVETIRYYEREKLLPEPARTEGNYRIYDEVHLRRLAFIRRCRTLDMNLDEVRVLLRFIDTPQKNCQEVNVLLDEHIEHVSQRVKELRALEKELRTLRSMCIEGTEAAHCGILGGLAKVEMMAGQQRSHVGSTHGKRRVAR